MDMNSKGQTALVCLMIGIFIFMMAMIFINPITDVITEARAADQLNCSSTTITDGQKATCLVVDLILPYFIGIVLAVAGGWIGAKILIG